MQKSRQFNVNQTDTRLSKPISSKQGSSKPGSSVPSHTDAKQSRSSLNKSRVKLLSYNIQVGIASTRPHHYVTQSWKHVFPHGKHLQNLDQIADVVSDYDIVGLQEVDGGSRRSEFINQTEYLAVKADFPYWSHQTNRRLGNIAQHSNGLLSKFDPLDIVDHKLPGRLPGRGAMVVRFGEESNPMIVVLMHLALGQKARLIQMNYVSQLVREYEHVVVMGDMNCQPDSEEFQSLLDNAGLVAPASGLNTFPSWKPSRRLDHILVSPSLIVENVSVLDIACSDHLPISMDIVIPEAVQLVA